MSDAAEKVQDVMADAAAEVAQQAEGAEQFIRSLNKIKIQFGLLGAAFGVAGGAMAAFAIAYRKAETKYSQIADDEIAEMREHYQDKILALDATAQKGDLEEIVAERGYTSPDAATASPPMAVSPPQPVVDAAKEATDEAKAADVVEDRPEPQTRNVFRDADEAAAITDAWDYDREVRRRSPDHPYVIHYDERNEFEDYQDVTLTYYEADDVLCNERDEIVSPEEREAMVGEKSLERFGHGSNDPRTVYVRNDKLELVLEVVKSPNSYAEEVHGFAHDAYGRNLQRMRAREHEQPDDD